jgi:hypothetical protein
MNNDSFHDPSLKSLEARLAAAPPQLSERDCQILLYECAFAAGQGAAQRTGAQSTRRWMTATSLLAVLCIGLALRLTTLTGRYESRLPGVVQHREPTQPQWPAPKFDDNDSRQITVASALDRVVDFNWPIQTPLSETSDADLSAASSEPVLTPRSRVLPNPLWN